jgi:hypothetical protein
VRSPQVISDALVAALGAVPGLRASVIDGRDFNPPQAIVGPPTLTYETFCGGAGPSEMSFPVTLIVKPDARSMERLFDMIPLVTDAVMGVEGAVVMTATPGTYGGSGEGLPAYTFEIEVSP